MSGGIGGEVTDLKSALFETPLADLGNDLTLETDGFEQTEITFITDGQLSSDGTVVAKANVKTSDFIPIAGIKIIRVGKNSTKYNFLPYCFYSAANEASFISPRMNPGTNYEYSNLYNHAYATEIDLTAYQGAKYIRISNSTADTVGSKYYIIKDVYAYDTEAEFTSATTRRLSDSISSVESKVDEYHKQPSVILCRQYDSGISPNTYIVPDTGSEIEASYDASPFIPVKTGDMLFLNYVHSMIFYDGNKTRIDGFGTNTIAGYITDLENVYTVDVEGTVYMRFNFRKYEGYGVTKINDDPYQVLNLGDSIFGLNIKPNDISTYAEIKTGIKFANCGFGGSRAAEHSQASYNAFSFYSLADAIYNEDFSTQESYLPSLNMAPYTMNLRILESIDFSKLRILTVAYGTNDWYGNSRPIDNPQNKYDTTTFCGGLRYGIEKIINKYPHLLICLCSPIYRYLLHEQESGDTLENAHGDTLVDYVDAMGSVANEYHLPFFNHYNIGINGLNRNTFLQQGSTHLTYFDGAKLVGDLFGGEIAMHF